MKKRFVLLLASVCVVLSMGAQTKTVESKTTYAKEALQPYVDSGQLAGAISVFYKDGVQETCCIGYADVAQKRPIEMDNVFMQCSQTKGFCGVTIAKLVEQTPVDRRKVRKRMIAAVEYTLEYNRRFTFFYLVVLPRNVRQIQIRFQTVVSVRSREKRCQSFYARNCVRPKINRHID